MERIEDFGGSILLIIAILTMARWLVIFRPRTDTLRGSPSHRVRSGRERNRERDLVPPFDFAQGGRGRRSGLCSSFSAVELALSESRASGMSRRAHPNDPAGCEPRRRAIPSPAQTQVRI